MIIIEAPNALVGEELILRNVYVVIDNGVIVEITDNIFDKPTITLSEDHLLIPGFVNPHIHLGDAFIKDIGLDVPLDRVVGKNGIKHLKLANSSDNNLISSLQNSISLLINNGYTSFADFREMGIKGVLLLKQVAKHHLIRGFILGRPNKNDNIMSVMDIADGIGLADVFALSDISITQLNNLKNRKNKKIIGIHVAETLEVVRKSLNLFKTLEIKKILSLIKPDFFVHANYITEEDIELIKKHSIGIISCPLSASYYSLKLPPLRKFLDERIIVALATDNILTSNPDPFRLMNYTLHVSRILQKALSPLEVLKMLTVNAGKILKQKIGQISEGYYADLLAINLKSSNTIYSRDIYTAVTLRADPRDIVLQMVGGNVIKWKNQKQ